MSRSGEPSSDEIEAYLRSSDERFRGWLSLLVSIDSEAPDEQEAQRAVAALGSSLGMVVEVSPSDEGDLAADERFIPTGMTFTDRPNVVVSMPRGTGPAIVCNAHVDTVAVGSGWTRNPYGEWAGDRFYGRGACDAKGSTVAALIAMTCLTELGLDAAQIQLHSVIDEEPGGNGSLAAARRLQEAGGRPPLVVVMEPSRLDLLHGHRGMIWYRFESRGKQGHGSTGEGVNAIEKAAEFISALRETAAGFASLPDDGRPHPSLNVGTIAGGTEVYTTPAVCDVEVSARYAIGQRTLVDTAIRDTVGAGRLPGEIVEVFRRDFDAAETPADDPAVLHALDVLRRHRPEAELGQLLGTCDMRHYREIVGSSAVIFGPGDLADAHGPDEHVEWSDVVTAARVLIDLAREMRSA